MTDGRKNNKGRPPKNKSRDYVLTVRITRLQHSKLNKLSIDSDMSNSDWVRACIENGLTFKTAVIRRYIDFAKILGDKTEDCNQYLTCPKCEQTSGNDWSQCDGSCPMPMSPHFSKTAPEEPATPEKPELPF